MAPTPVGSVVLKAQDPRRGCGKGALMRRLEGVEGPCSTSVRPLALRGLKLGESGGRGKEEVSWFWWPAWLV